MKRTKPTTPWQALLALTRQSAFKTNTHLVCSHCNAWATLGPTGKDDAMELPHADDCPFTLLGAVVPRDLASPRGAGE